MNESVIKELSAVMVQRGYRVPTTTIYQKMREWVDFYMGEVTDFHKFNLAYHCGNAVTLSGNAAEKNGQLVLSKITELKPLSGKNPGSKNG